MNTLADNLISKAIDLGATVAGLANMDELLSTPSHKGFPINGQAKKEDSVLVTGLHHPPSRPELDWYTGRGGTEGNRVLMRVNSNLCDWLDEKYGIQAQDLPYYVEKGGVFLKDAAILAGLGVVGINNLFMVHGYGPNVRFRGLLVNAPLPVARRSDYSPCEGCHRPCLHICPEGALGEDFFDREACLRHMAKDRHDAGSPVMDSPSETEKVEIRFCRECELVCPLSGSA
jgi:epoxyqueuosine reductase